MSLHDATPGDVVKVSLDLVAAAYKIPAGHKLGLAIDTFDAEYAVPTVQPYVLKLSYGSDAQPRLTVPFAAGR